MKDKKNKVTAMAMATTIAVTTMAPVPTTTVYAQELDKTQIETKVKEESKAQDITKVEALESENKGAVESNKETNIVKDEKKEESINNKEKEESTSNKENNEDKVKEEEKENTEEKDKEDNQDNKENLDENTKVEDQEKKEEAEIKDSNEKNEVIENIEDKNNTEKAENNKESSEDKTLEKVETDVKDKDLSKAEENKENEDKDNTGKEKATTVVFNDVNFPDSQFRNYLSSTYKFSDGDPLSDVEIENVKNIDVTTYKAISSLKGIEHFTNLETLNCTGTAITSLDVSSNTKLKTLNCFNTKLASLNIGNNNNLTSIKINDTITFNDYIITTPEFNIKENLDIMDINNVTVDSPLNLDKTTGVVSGYGSEINYKYNCGTSKNGQLNLNVKVNVNIIEINETNVPDAEFRRYIKNEIAFDLKLTQKEIDDVTEIETQPLLGGKYDIRDFTGIEIFTNLKELNCSEANLTTPLDLSKNVNLETLDCSNSGIKELNVENNVNLNYLNCSNNDISSLDISKNDKLETLNCSGTKISNLDVTSSKSLKVLDCYEMNVDNLTIKTNAALTRLLCMGSENKKVNINLDISNSNILEELNCSNTNITELNLVNNPKLRELNCSNTNITELNLSNNKELSRLICANTNITDLNVSNMEKLNELDCRDSIKLNNINLSGTTNLANLTLSDTAISSLDVSHITNLASLYLNNTPIKELDLTKNSMLGTLDCSGTEITKLDLSKNANLTQIFFVDTKIVNLDIGTGKNIYAFTQTEGNPHQTGDFKIEVDFTVTDDTFSVKEKLGFNEGEIKITSGAILNGDVISNYEIGQPIVYEYTVGSYEYVSGAQPQHFDVTMEVTLNPVKAESAISIINLDNIKKVYDGKPVNLTKGDCQITGSKGAVTFTYYDSKGTELSSAPTEAGKYKVKAEVAETTYYKSAETVVDFEITKAKPNTVVEPSNLSAISGSKLSTIALSSGWEWVNPEETVIVKNSGYKARLKVDDKNYDYKGIEGYNSKEHYVERTLKVSVSKAQNTWKVTPSIKSWTYGENANAPVGSASYGTVTFTYSNSKTGTFTDIVPTEAGTWYMKANVSEGDEYTGLNKVVEFKIEKAKAKELINPSNLSAVQGDELNTIKLPSGWEWVNPTETVNVNNSGYKARIKVDDKNYDYTGVEGYNSKGHYVERTLKVSVAKGENTWIISPAIKNWTYNQAPNSPVGSAKNGTVSFTYSNSKTGTFTDVVPTEAGIWYMKATVAESEEYKELSEVIEFKIEKANAQEIIIPNNLSAVQDDELNTINLPSGWEWVTPNQKVTTKNNGYKARLKVDDKNYDYTGVEGYNSKGSYVERTLEVSVSKGENAWTIAPQIKGWTYGEKAKSPVGSAEHGDVVFTYSNSKTGTFTDKVPTEAGRWYMKATVLSSDEYKGLNEIVEFTIEKATIKEVVNPSNLSGVQDNKLSTIVLPEGWTWVNPTEIATVKNNGYLARLKVDDKNYDYTGIEGYNEAGHYVERRLEVSVAKGENTWIISPAIKNWTYNQAPNSPVGSAKNGTVSFTYSNSKTGTFTDVVPTEAGTWYMKATVAESEEYKELSEIVEFTIEKAIPNYEAPKDITAIYGQTLKEVILPEGFSWKNGEEVVGNAGTNKFKISYTPQDTNNYKVVNNIEIDIVVKQAVNKWIEELSIEGWTYGEKPNKPVASAQFGEVKFTYSNTKGRAYTGEIPTEAGTWYVKAEVIGNDNYTGISQVKEFKIEKAVAPEIVLPDNLSAVQDDKLDSVSLPENWTWVDKSQTVTIKNNGYKARLKVDDKNYDYTKVEGYNEDGGYVERVLQVSVSKVQNTWKVTPSIKGWTYGEKANTPVGDSKYGDVIFTYSNSKTGTFTDVVPTDAGKWYMKATVLSTDEYTGFNEIIEFEIKKATPKFEIPKDIKEFYGQTLEDIKLPEGFTWKDDKQPVGNVGTNKFIVIYTPEDINNYEIVENIEIDVIVEKVKNNWTEDISIEDWTYGDKASNPSASGKFGEVIYVYSNKKDGEYTTDVPTEAGKWYVKAVVEETENYYGLESKALVFNITPKDGTQLSISEIKSDKDLDNLIIKDGSKILDSSKDYKVTKKQEGNTVTVTITFKGNYTGTIIKTYEVEVKPSLPQTGERSNLGLWGLLLTITGGAIAFITGKGNKRIRKEK